MTKKIYFAVAKEKDGGCWCEIPDLPTDLIEGNTIEKLIRETTQVAQGMTDCLKADNELIPEKTERINIYALSHSVKLISPTAEKQRISRLAYFIRSALEYTRQVHP